MRVGWVVCLGSGTGVGVPGSDQDHLNEGLQVCAGQPGRASWWPPRPSSDCAPTSRAENTRSLSKTKTIKMTTTTLTKGSDGRDCGAWCPPCSGAAQYGDPLAAFDPLTEGIRSYHDAGNTTNMRASPAILATRLRPARRLRTGGHPSRVRALNPITAATFPHSTPRSPTSAMSSATRPTNRSPAKARR